MDFRMRIEIGRVLMSLRITIRTGDLAVVGQMKKLSRYNWI
jgi:hypothetical protein